jgi:hypothetical protein
MNGGACCLLAVCCPPEGGDPFTSEPGVAVHPKRLRVLAREIKQRTSASADVAREVAELVLTHFDLVPKGMGDTIVEAYRPFFAQLAAEGAGE